MTIAVKIDKIDAESNKNDDFKAFNISNNYLRILGRFLQTLLCDKPSWMHSVVSNLTWFFLQKQNIYPNSAQYICQVHGQLAC